MEDIPRMYRQRIQDGQFAFVSQTPEDFMIDMEQHGGYMNALEQRAMIIERSYFNDMARYRYNVTTEAIERIQSRFGENGLLAREFDERAYDFAVARRDAIIRLMDKIQLSDEVYRELQRLNDYILFSDSRHEQQLF